MPLYLNYLFVFESFSLHIAAIMDDSAKKTSNIRNLNKIKRELPMEVSHVLDLVINCTGQPKTAITPELLEPLLKYAKFIYSYIKEFSRGLSEKDASDILQRYISSIGSKSRIPPHLVKNIIAAQHKDFVQLSKSRNVKGLVEELVEIFEIILNVKVGASNFGETVRDIEIDISSTSVQDVTPVVASSQDTVQDVTPSQAPVQAPSQDVTSSQDTVQDVTPVAVSSQAPVQDVTPVAVPVQVPSQDVTPVTVSSAQVQETALEEQDSVPIPQSPAPEPEQEDVQEQPVTQDNAVEDAVQDSQEDTVQDSQVQDNSTEDVVQEDNSTDDAQVQDNSTEDVVQEDNSTDDAQVQDNSTEDVVQDAQLPEEPTTQEDVQDPQTDQALFSYPDQPETYDYDLNSVTDAQLQDDSSQDNDSIVDAQVQDDSAQNVVSVVDLSQIPADLVVSLQERIRTSKIVIVLIQ